MRFRDRMLPDSLTTFGQSAGPAIEWHCFRIQDWRPQPANSKQELGYPSSPCHEAGHRSLCCGAVVKLEACVSEGEWSHAHDDDVEW